ncbi:CPBP family intramembrane metalloprotease [Actinocrinis puniceicyclus]|uniref:CPBP family intramembrane metalloprotease n=1 Tax=Actinocrinis puniceicyclus TaxID=977794 RepID=A0A8J8BCF6_9ACTN|nr:CPBP family intramembrane glutamic endopeptidase [Actinocrinis puniceicyclus]MBS2963475.1 CPBP family intramembrane metalloprotease [Actinocrinis puniceicyclus]
MWSRTLCLECLVLAATIAPAELVRVATAFGMRGHGAARAARTATYGVPAAYSAVCAAAIAVAATGGFSPGYLSSWSVGALWVVGAVVAGCAVVALEFGLGAAPYLLRGKRGLRLGVMLASGSVDAAFVASVVATGIAEELLYRGLWIGILHERLGLVLPAAILAAACAYALGHVFFGMNVVAQKATTGAVFGVLLVSSGSVVVPLLAHVTQNLVVSALGARQAARA